MPSFKKPVKRATESSKTPDIMNANFIPKAEAAKPHREKLIKEAKRVALEAIPIMPPVKSVGAFLLIAE